MRWTLEKRSGSRLPLYNLTFVPGPTPFVRARGGFQATRKQPVYATDGEPCHGYHHRGVRHGALKRTYEISKSQKSRDFARRISDFQMISLISEYCHDFLISAMISLISFVISDFCCDFRISAFARLDCLASPPVFAYLSIVIAYID